MSSSTVGDAVCEDFFLYFVDDLGFQIGMLVRNLKNEMRILGIKRVENFTSVIKIAILDKVLPNFLGLFLAQLNFGAVVGGGYETPTAGVNLGEGEFWKAGVCTNSK